MAWVRLVPLGDLRAQVTALKTGERRFLELLDRYGVVKSSNTAADKLLKRSRGRVQIAVVGNRVKEHTLATEHLGEYLDTVKVPVLTMLRDTQNYAHLAAHGLTLFDVAPHKIERDLELWQPLTKWLDKA